MSGPQFMPFYVGDYLRDTQHLTTEQHGAYLLLLFACWTQGGYLPNNDAELAAITRLPINQWRRVRRKIAKFFKISVKFWAQKRVAVELERAQRLHDVRSKAGSKGGSKTQARARVPQPQPQLEKEGERSKAKPQASTPPPEKPSSEPPGRARESGAGKEEVFLDGNWKPVGRFAPLAASRPKPASPALKARKKELLRQKLLRFVAARLPASDEHAATLGLCGGDPEHSEQWWFDALDIRMRAEKWDDTQEFWEGENV